jgi:hypothetical protein
MVKEFSSKRSEAELKLFHHRKIYSSSNRFAKKFPSSCFFGSMLLPNQCFRRCLVQGLQYFMPTAASTPVAYQTSKMPLYLRTRLYSDVKPKAVNAAHSRVEELCDIWSRADRGSDTPMIPTRGAPCGCPLV